MNPREEYPPDRRVEDWRLSRIEETLDAQTQTLKNIEAQMERIVRLEERGTSRDHTIKNISQTVDYCDARGESHASRITSLESQVVALTWFSRLITAGVVGGFITWLWSLKNGGISP